MRIRPDLLLNILPEITKKGMAEWKDDAHHHSHYWSNIRFLCEAPALDKCHWGCYAV